jgi:hypothetical protein
MANQQITELPQAGALVGTEAVPIVQNGVTVQTTTGAISGAGALNYPFLTVGQTAGLPQSRYISTNAGLSLTDNGVQGTLQVNLIGAALSLNSSGNGIQVKTASNTVTAREIAVGTGLGITNADGVSGNPTVALGTFLQQLVSQSGTGFLVLQSGSPAKVEIEGTTNQISISNGNGAANPVVSLATNLIIPGTGSVTVPNGTTVQRSGSFGAFRYNTNLQQFEGFTSTGWNQFSLTGGVTSFSAGTTGFSPNTDTTGAVTLSGILNPASGGTGVNNNTYTITLGGNVSTGGALTTAGTFTTAANFATAGAFAMTLTATGVTSVTLPNSGTFATLAGSETLTNKTISGASNTLSNIANASLTNSSVTYNGVNVALGASGTITATTTAALTVGTGLQLNTGTTFDGSAARTIGIDSTVATLTGSQTLTNKVMSGANNTFSNIGNSSLTNSSITIGSTAVSLGGSITTFAGTSISGSTNTLSNIGNASLTNSSVTVGTTNIALGATSLTLGGLTSVAVTQDPVSALQLTTKQYVDTLIASGIHYHQPVLVESPTPLNATYNNGTAGVGATLTNAGTQAALVIDGVTVAVNDRVLIYTQTNATQNGIYVVTNVGSGSTNWVLTRSSDADTYVINNASGLSEGSTVFVQQGTTGAGETYTCNTSGVITFGTTNITFAQISATQIYSAGAGLTLTGTQFSITAPVTVPLGGTGVTTLTGLAYGNGTSAFTAASAAQVVAVIGSTAVTNATNATNATNTAVTANSTNATNYLTFVSATSGNVPQLVNSSITCNPSTGQMTGGIAGGAF